MELAATWDAPLDEVGVAALPDPDSEVSVPEAVPLAAAPVGEPKVETPDVTGPTGADAEAPMPTKPPIPCYNERNKNV